MKINNPFLKLTRFETLLWLTSVTVIFISSLFSGAEGLISGLASIIGVTALIFVAKGMITGQILCIIFALMYGIISLCFRYYGEAFTYIGMSLPMAVVSLFAWLKHPYKDADEVTVAHLSGKKVFLVISTSLLATIVFYFILRWLDTPNLIVSTVSITTSWAACLLTLLRSPYYAVAYSLNDLVLILLWSNQTFTDFSCIPLVCCFIMFLANDLYAFYNWKRMQKLQSDDQEDSL